MRSATLHKVLAALLAVIVAALAALHLGPVRTMDLPTAVRWIAGLVAGSLIGIVAALMCVAGGELLIPTIVLLYGIDIKLAGSLSLAVSLPTMLIAIARYSQDARFQIVRSNKGLRCDDDRWIDHGNCARWTAARGRSQCGDRATARGASAGFVGEGMASRMMIF
jgi:hypothetical protein